MKDTLYLFTAALIVANIIGFFLVGSDKRRSMRQGSERVPEVWLFFVAIFFASLGVFTGLFFFHHKTRKLYFPLGIGLLFIEQAALLYLIAGGRVW
jgi:uncharacterized membrane protein YsdA (DUF1294 family)